MQKKLIANYSFLLVSLTTCLFFNACYVESEGCLDRYATNYDLSSDFSCDDCCTYPNFNINTEHSINDTILLLDSIYNISGQQIVIDESYFYIREVHPLNSSLQEIGSTDSLDLISKSNEIIRVENNIFILDPKSSINKCENLIVKDSIYGIKFIVGLNDLSSNLDYTQLDTTSMLFLTGKYMYDLNSSSYNNAKTIYKLDTLSTSPVYTLDSKKSFDITLFYSEPKAIAIGESNSFSIKINYNRLFDNINFETDEINTINEKWEENINSAFGIIE